ncbi:hypothetical protein Bca4012_059389 [Brassica carinata]
MVISLVSSFQGDKKQEINCPKNLSGTKIETAPPSSVLDAGGASGRRRRGLRLYAVMLAPFFLFFTSVSSLNRCFSILTIAFVIAAGSPRRQPVAVSRNAWLFPYGSGFTDRTFYGVPNPSLLSTFAICSAAPTCFNHSAVLPTSESTSFSRLSDLFFTNQIHRYLRRV